MRQISLGQKIFNIFNTLFMLVLVVIMLYPVWYVVVASFSDSTELMKHSGVLLLPIQFTTNAYELMSRNPMIFKGYANTLVILISSLFLQLIMTSLAAYGLSRRNVLWTKYIMIMIVITMYFSGGLIPRYLLISKTLHLRDSFLALILPAAISTFNMIIMKTSFASIPSSLEEAASIDGAGHWTILFRIVIPLSMPVIAVIILYYAVSTWNAWFDASIYITTREKFPLQLILREILISNDTSTMTANTGDASDQMSIGESVKYAVIVVATIPILCVYPFLQKYFVNGVMIGAVKG